MTVLQDLKLLGSAAALRSWSGFLARRSRGAAKAAAGRWTRFRSREPSSTSTRPPAAKADAGAWLAQSLRELGYQVTEQPVADGRFNVFARTRLAVRCRVLDALRLRAAVLPQPRGARPAVRPRVVRRERHPGGAGGGRRAAARRAGRRASGSCSWSGEERGSDGARVANDCAPLGVKYLVNGEPTDNRLGSATRGVLRVRLHAEGRAAHSAFPELGESAIDKLLDALMVIRGLQLPEDPLLGRTHYTVGVIEGGVAPNVISPRASAELLFRIVGDAAPVRAALAVVEGLVSIEHVLDVPAVRLHTVPGFETAVFPYTTDVPLLTRWGTPLLVGPGSIHVAHTDDEHVAIDELLAAVDLYENLAMRLLAGSASPNPA